MMQVLKAHVRNGRLVLDEPTDLPEGDIVYLQPLAGIVHVGDDDLDLTEEEQAELHRELELSIAEADSGDTEDFAKVLADLRQRHRS